ncbi:MAG: glycosyltransferase [Candidatus Eremiobacteraeota bacterium]|nr:glycosyltransferase [Candidatus Eremiobacteraeota bacterium]
MRIAFVSEHASPLATIGGEDAGGQNIHVAALASAMSRAGAEVRVYTRRDDRKLPGTVPFADGVLVEHVDAGPPEFIEKDRLAPFMPAFGEELARRWTRWAPQVVHAHFWMSGMAALAAGRKHDVPVVQTFHALGIEKLRHQGAKDTSPPHRICDEKNLARSVSHIVATATAEAFQLVRMGAQRSRISVIPCGVDLSLFSVDGAVERRDSRRSRLVCVGRLVERKGIDDVIRALVRLDNVELVIAGGPDVSLLDADPEAVRLRALAESLGVADRVIFRGRIPHAGVPALLRSADIAVCYPRYEPFGIVPLEAMACGVPVVAASVGGLVDSVIDGVTGALVPPHSPDELAGALQRLLLNRARLARLGAAGVRHVRGRYGWRRIASDTTDVYAKLIAQPRTAVVAS